MPFMTGGTAAIASVALSAVGTVTSAIGAFQQAAAAQAQAEFSAAVNRNNAIIAQRNADSIRDAGDVEAEEHRRKIGQAKGAAIAALAANGMLVDDEDPNATSQVLVQDIVETGEIDILRLRHNTELEALRVEAQGMNFLAQAQQNQLAADSESPGFAAFGTLLEGGASTLGRAAQFGVKIP